MHRRGKADSETIFHTFVTMNVRQNIVFLSLGSNRGDRMEALRKAERLIAERIGTVTGRSPVVESRPWGFTDETLFLNNVLEVFTSLSPHEILQIAGEIEKEMGRERKVPEYDESGKRVYSSRIMDIDILFYNDVILESKELTLPHPAMAIRRFVLAPFSMFRPGYLHPVLQKTMRELLDECPDKSEVRVISDQQEER